MVTWKLPPADDKSRDHYRLSPCGRYALRKCGQVYGLARLGRRDGDAYVGSEPICTGTRAECEAAYAEATREAA